MKTLQWQEGRKEEDRRENGYWQYQVAKRFCVPEPITYLFSNAKLSTNYAYSCIRKATSTKRNKTRLQMGFVETEGELSFRKIHHVAPFPILSKWREPTAFTSLQTIASLMPPR